MSRIQLSLALVLGSLVGCGMTGTGSTGDGTAPPFTDGVSTLSGASAPGYVDGARGTARFHNPVTVAYGPDGKLYVGDFDNDKIRVVDVETGDTTTLINQTNFKKPFALAFGKDGVLYVSTDDDGAGGHGLMSGSVWRIYPGTTTAQLIVQKIGRPRGLAVLADGRLAMADYDHHVIEILDVASGALTTLAGTWDQKGMTDASGAAARFSTPYGLVARPDGTLVVADYDNHRLRVVGMDGNVTTLAGAGVAGFADGAMPDAMFNHPQGLAVTTSGDIYVTDLGNYRIRKISGTAVETVAGDGKAGYHDDDDVLAAEFYGLEGMSLEPDGARLFIADGSRGESLPYNSVRVINN
jgi:sugar lactone lactonase YvrE